MNWKLQQPQDFSVSPFDLIGSQWMLVTAQKPDGSVNTMTASWGGMGVLWGKNVAFVFLRPQRYTKEFVDQAGRFTLTFFDGEYKKALGYLGSVSGRNEDKIAKSGLTVEQLDGQPVFSQARIALLCRSMCAQELDPACFLETEHDQKWYPEKDYHTVYVAEIEKIYLADSQ